MKALKLPAKARELGAALRQRRSERKRLRGPADLHYAIADSVSMLNADAWRALTANAGIFMSIEYLAMLERVLPHTMSARYALIHAEEDGQLVPVAALYMQLADVGLKQSRSGESDAAGWKKPLRKLEAAATQRLLVCGNLLSYGQHGVAFAQDIDPALAWHGVAEVLYRVRQADRLRGKTHFVIVKDLHSHWIDQAKRLSTLSYRYVETEPNMVLQLDPAWRSYDDYLASLASKYRSNARNAILKPIDEGGCRIEAMTDLAAHEARVFELYKSVQANAGLRPFELRPEYFAALQRMAGSRMRCSGLWRGDKLLGFLVSLADGDTSIAYHIGFDREAAAELPIYLRLLHAGIADAIALGCKRISYGRTALEPKASLGAQPEDFGVLVRHRQPVLNKLLKHVLLGIEHADAPERNPFKKTKE
ncbi:MAG: GNAT family N-acetyltransferase [Rhodocyclaceae bacterium]